jgi:HAD superfamily hydrolase (TIGR01459 family)
LREISGLSSVKKNFDGFILDLWGLIHDGVSPYKGVIDTFVALKNNNIETVLLSNAPRRSSALIDGMQKMGIDRSLYGEIFSSGEATWQEIVQKNDPFFSSLGDNVYHLGPERDNSLIEETKLKKVNSLRKADFILNTGPIEFNHNIENYNSILQEAINEKLPMVCANPDEIVIRGGYKIICAGLIAKKFKKMGGNVVYRGKPDPRIYDLAIKKLNCRNKDRVAIIGDSLETDVAGAKAANLKSIWCTGGIHAEELNVTYGQSASLISAERLANQKDLNPWAIIPGFFW